jgi:hypothetical protein
MISDGDIQHDIRCGVPEAFELEPGGKDILLEMKLEMKYGTGSLKGELTFTNIDEDVDLIVPIPDINIGFPDGFAIIEYCIQDGNTKIIKDSIHK